MIEEALRSSSIEGEFLSRQDVMSSIKNHLGTTPKEQVNDLRAAGIGELMTKIRKSFKNPLDQATLFDWHKTLLQGSHHISLGAWRTGDEPMRVVSGRIDNPKIHFEAPHSKEVPHQIDSFLNWFNHTKNTLNESPIKAGIAHLYFESIHPFEDGNGRIGRSISDKALAQGAGNFAMLSLSQVMEEKRNDYYGALKSAQRSNEITPWLTYFVQTSLQAQQKAEEEILFILKKARFFSQQTGHQLNPRQQKAIHRMFEVGVTGFEGGMDVRKYTSLTKTSKATATRDLQDLVSQGILAPSGKARATKYTLIL